MGEVLASFGYKAEAIEAVDQAIRLNPASNTTRLRMADLLLDARRFDDAEAQLVAAEPLADDEGRRGVVLGERITLDEASGRLLARVEALKTEAAGPKAGDAPAGRRLARYAEAALDRSRRSPPRRPWRLMGARSPRGPGRVAR